MPAASSITVIGDYQIDPYLSSNLVLNDESASNSTSNSNKKDQKKKKKRKRKEEGASTTVDTTEQNCLRILAASTSLTKFLQNDGGNDLPIRFDR